MNIEIYVIHATSDRAILHFAVEENLFKEKDALIRIWVYV